MYYSDSFFKREFTVVCKARWHEQRLQSSGEFILLRSALFTLLHVMVYKKYVKNGNAEFERFRRCSL